MNSQYYLYIHDIALANTLKPDIGHYYRQICRWYSQKFHTPLHVVYELPPGMVLLNYYESQMAEADEEELEKIIWRTMNPDLDEDEEEDIQDFIKMVESEEIKKGRLKPKKITKDKQSKEQESLSQEQGGTVVRTYDDTPPPVLSKDSKLQDLDLDFLIPKPVEDDE